MKRDEYLMAFKRQYKKLMTINKIMSMSERTKEALVWAILTQNTVVIIRLLEEEPISKSMIKKVALIMENNLTEILKNVAPDGLLLVRIKDLVISIISFCSRKKKK
jgi:CMP-2-keto-3-deoxyoctulosonic acid synthetase